ncbi:hypothetical protein HY993_01645 [Candidatus Micrarchaeota archaeon]|nr:hypothetical protein [Candidatus Micrarchaeota archaeon]
MKCHCGKTLKESKLEFRGFLISGFKCSNCGQELFNPYEVDKVRKALNKQVKARKIAHSLVITLPKPVASLVKISEGDVLQWLVSKNKLILQKASVA